MNITISPSKAQGTVTAPPSKSMAHRYLIAAGLSKGKSIVRNLAPSQDILATIDCLRSLGAQIEFDGATATIIGTNPVTANPQVPLNCRESGSTLRFFIPLCLLSNTPTTLVGYGRLMQRPQSVYETICQEQGLTFYQTEETIHLEGPLQAGNFTLQGNISSQFITGLLFALPFANGECTITILPPVESRSYINLTLSVLQEFGIEARWLNDTTLQVVPGTYTARNVTVEGDYSNAAFLDAFNYLGGKVTLNGLNPCSLQGDKVFKQGFDALYHGVPSLSLMDCPDLGPIYMAMAAALHGATFTDTARLKIKESDRGMAMALELAKFGAKTEVLENSIIVHPSSLSAPNEPLNAHNDHRIVMALATLCTITGGTIVNAQAVEKSFPEYFQVISSLGVSLKEV